MHLVIRTDGRTERHGDGGDTRCGIAIPHHSNRHRAALSLGTEHVLPLRCPRDDHGQYTLWVARWTVAGDAGLRNIPAALLGAQWGLAPRVLAGPVAITHTGSEASAFVSDQRWSYVEELAEDIVRAMHGQTPYSVIHEPAWPQAMRLAAAVLADAKRPAVPADASDAEAMRVLLAELQIEVAS